MRAERPRGTLAACTSTARSSAGASSSSSSGPIPLAVQAGLLTAEQVADWWRFWPLILVGIGLGLLLRRTAFEALGGLIVAATFGIMLGAALSSGIGGVGGIPGGVCGPLDDGVAFPTQDGQFPSTSATVEIDLDCGDV